MKKSTTKGMDSERNLPSRTTHVRQPAAQFRIRKLGSETWPDFARIVEKHNGVWGGCWCVAFHLNRSQEKEWTGKHRAQFGPPVELPARMSGFNRLGEALPDWRITCFFVDRDHRKEGVAKAALEGALRVIGGKGGGAVGGYPIDTRGKPYSSSFLWGGTEAMFAALGFCPLGGRGTSKWMMR